MHKKAKRALIFTIAIIFLILGLAGFVLPILQGFLLVAIGFILLSFCFPEFRLWMHKHTKKYPHLSAIIDKTEKWMGKIIGKV